MNKIKTKNGFTLAEVLVSLAVLTLVIVSATNLVVSIVRTNTDNLNTMIAYGLAQEGIEGIRNIRDSNWLLGADYDGTITFRGSPAQIWGAALKPGFYTIDLLNLGSAAVNEKSVTDVVSISDYAPWRLAKIDDEDVYSDSTVLNKITSSDEGSFRYGHNVPSGSQEKPTIFHRWVEIEGISNDGSDPPDQYRVTCGVWFDEYGKRKEIKLQTDLTDWNQGQL